MEDPLLSKTVRKEEEDEDEDEDKDDDDDDSNNASSANVDFTAQKETRVRSNSGQQRMGSFLRSIQRWLQDINNTIEQEGIAFRSRLGPKDLNDLRLARILFHCCSIVPPLLYYNYKSKNNNNGGTSSSTTVDRPPKFPASISFTIRKGPPQRAHLVLWSAGWAFFFRVLRRSGSKSLGRFTIKMMLAGLWTTSIFRLGRGALSDVMHFIGAGVYMLDHVVMMKVLRTHRKYQAVFYSSLLCLMGSIGRLLRLEHRAKVPSESDIHTTTKMRARYLARLPPKMRSAIFWTELLLMVSENLLFAGFVQGIVSGLPQNKGEQQERTEQKDSEDQKKESKKTRT